jgi:hypothetical protein
MDIPTTSTPPVAGPDAMINSPHLAALAALAMLPWLPQVASASDAALAQCRALAEAQARLACYDRIPLASAAPAPAPAAAAKSPAMAATVAAGPAAVSPTAAAQPALDPAATLGLPQRPEQAERVSSSINGRFEGWSPRGRIRLANGQVWEVADGSSGTYWLQNPAVTVRRTMFGSFEMDIDGVNQRLRVRRVAD